MDKRNPKKIKEKEKSAKKGQNKLTNPQILLEKDIIYCKNTIQNTNPNINININIKNSKNKSSNRVKSAHYTIHSKQMKTINKSVDKKKRPYELKKIYLNTFGNNTLTNTNNSKHKNRSLKTYLINTNKNIQSNPKSFSNTKKTNKSSKVNISINCSNKDNLKNKNLFGSSNKKKKSNELIAKIMENKYESKATLFGDDMEIMSEYENLKSIWNELGVTNNFIQNFEYMNNNKNRKKTNVAI